MVYWVLFIVFTEFIHGSLWPFVISFTEFLFGLLGPFIAFKMFYMVFCGPFYFIYGVFIWFIRPYLLHLYCFSLGIGSSFNYCIYKVFTWFIRPPLLNLYCFSWLIRPSLFLLGPLYCIYIAFHGLLGPLYCIYIAFQGL